MKVVLATGIYPPSIGGPATYVQALEEELVRRGVGVVVVTYGDGKKGTPALEPSSVRGAAEGTKGTEVVRVLKRGGPFLRWWKYMYALRNHAADADVVIAFSLVSCGVPLWLAKLERPKKMLRLGGDFLWERYTDCGGLLGLKEWYASRFWFVVASLPRCLVNRLLGAFHYVVFSTRLQEEICEEHYRRLPPHSVIENALPAPTPDPSPHPNGCSSGRAAAAGEGRTRHTPFRLLFIGRFVAFKNLSALLRALTELPEITLTLVGEGPLRHLLEGNVRGLGLQERVIFRPRVTSEERDQYFHAHDLLVIPSVTEISPNAALEARAMGLPVLLTEENGFSERLRQGMVIRKLRTPEQIRDAIRETRVNYAYIAREAAKLPIGRSWGMVCEEYLSLFDRMLCPSPSPSPAGRGKDL